MQFMVHNSGGEMDQMHAYNIGVASVTFKEDNLE